MAVVLVGSLLVHIWPYHAGIGATCSLVGCNVLLASFNIYNVLFRCQSFMHIQHSWLHLSDFQLFM